MRLGDCPFSNVRNTLRAFSSLTEAVGDLFTPQDRERVKVALVTKFCPPEVQQAIDSINPHVDFLTPDPKCREILEKCGIRNSL